MAACEYGSSCYFLNKMVVDMAPAAEMVKDKYCDGDFGECARFKVSKSRGIDYVPENLSPDSFKRPK